jgi:hypothetical protein
MMLAYHSSIQYLLGQVAVTEVHPDFQANRRNAAHMCCTLHAMVLIMDRQLAGMCGTGAM